MAYSALTILTPRFVVKTQMLYEKMRKLSISWCGAKNCTYKNFNRPVFHFIIITLIVEYNFIEVVNTDHLTERLI